MNEKKNIIKNKIAEISVKILRGEIASYIFIKHKKISFLILLLLILYIGNAIYSEKKHEEILEAKKECERLKAKKTDLEFILAEKSNVFEIEKKLNQHKSKLTIKGNSKKTQATSIIKYHVEREK